MAENRTAMKKVCREQNFQVFLQKSAFPERADLLKLLFSYSRHNDRQKEKRRNHLDYAVWQ